MVDTWVEDVDIEQGFTGPVEMPSGAVGPRLSNLFPDTSSWEQAAGIMSAAGIGNIGDTTPPAWWDSQVGGKAYGLHHKSSPEHYKYAFNLQPGNIYNRYDLMGNRMLGDLDQIDWSYDQTTPYRRSNPLIRSHWSGIGEDIPDSLLFDPIYDDERRLEGYSWNPYKDENIPFMEEEVTEDAISPYLGQWQDLFEFRDFPWMNKGNPVLTETFQGDNFANLSQTWEDILNRTGSEDLANEWLATQQTANIENFDYYHYRRNGYTHDETIQILEEQGLA